MSNVTDIKKGKPSLLEQAHAVPVMRRTETIGPTDEQLELAVAWYKHQVTTKQVSVVAKLPASSVPDKLQLWVKAGIAAGRVRLKGPMASPPIIADADDDE